MAKKCCKCGCLFCNGKCYEMLMCASLICIGIISALTMANPFHLIGGIISAMLGVLMFFEMETR